MCVCFRETERKSSTSVLKSLGTYLLLVYSLNTCTGVSKYVCVCRIERERDFSICTRLNSLGNCRLLVYSINTCTGVSKCVCVGERDFRTRTKLNGVGNYRLLVYSLNTCVCVCRSERERNISELVLFYYLTHYVHPLL